MLRILTIITEKLMATIIALAVQLHLGYEMPVKLLTKLTGLNRAGLKPYMKEIGLYETNDSKVAVITEP